MLPLPFDLETKAVLRQLSLSHRRLAELKGVARTIPNEQILINTLTLQEAKDSSSEPTLRIASLLRRGTRCGARVLQRPVAKALLCWNLGTFVCTATNIDR